MQVKVHIKKKRFKKNKIIHNYKPCLSVNLINKGFCFFIDKQIECARRVISKKSQRIGKLYILVLSKISTTKKPRGSRMGKGKGKFNKFVYQITPGAFIFKFFSPSMGNGRKILAFSKKKLPNLSSISV